MLHVLNEALSPAEALVYTMWCGEQCIVFDNGDTVPPGFDFYLEGGADLSDCDQCVARLRTKAVAAAEAL